MKTMYQHRISFLKKLYKDEIKIFKDDCEKEKESCWICTDKTGCNIIVSRIILERIRELTELSNDN